MTNYINSVKKQFEYYKTLGERTFGQISEDKLFWRPNEESNSIATIIVHLNGNMISRWTDFLSTDGEKEWRKRDREFANGVMTKKELLSKWNEGWRCLFRALDGLKDKDLDKEVFIRNMGHTVFEAINRQLAHYPYHIGQIVYLGKMIQDEKWNSLSISRGKSHDYNKEKFSKPKRKEHFTDDL